MRTKGIRRLGPGSCALEAALAAVLAAGLLAGSGCAWNYAAQEESTTDRSKPNGNDDPNVVEIDQKTGSGEEKPERGADATGGGSADASNSESPCGIRSFEIHYYDKTARITKRIDCLHRKVVSVNRTPISRQKRKAAQAAGLPESTWYLLVDPKGIRTKYLEKQELTGIQREFDLQFLGRDEKRNLLIYQYRGEL